MEIVKIESLKNQFRRAAKRSDELTDKIARLQKGEALVISAKEADKWKFERAKIEDWIAKQG